MFDNYVHCTKSQLDNLPHRTLKGTTVVVETINLYTQGLLPAQGWIFTTRTKSLRFYRPTPADIPASQYSHSVLQCMCHSVKVKNVGCIKTTALAELINEALFAVHHDQV